MRVFCHRCPNPTQWGQYTGPDGGQRGNGPCGPPSFPERINPGDRQHRLFNIVKIVSGMDGETLDAVADVYGSIIEAGIYRAPTIKVAEAAKLVENSQRDINIALVNEFAMVFSQMGIETKEVIKAMNTKWNALGFIPVL